MDRVGIAQEHEQSRAGLTFWAVKNKFIKSDFKNRKIQQTLLAAVYESSKLNNFFGNFVK